MRRRDFLGAVTASLVAGATATADSQTPSTSKLKGRIKQGVTRGVFALARGASIEDSCREAARLGIKGFDLIGPADWPTLKKHGLVPSMYPGGPGGTIPVALNRKEDHEPLTGLMHPAIDDAAANRAEEHTSELQSPCNLVCR